MAAHFALALVRLSRWTTHIGVPLLVWTVDKPWLQKRFLHDRRIWMITTNHPARAVALRDGAPLTRSADLMPTPEEITRFHDDDHPDSDAWVEGYVQTPLPSASWSTTSAGRPTSSASPAWSASALGERVLEIHHVGSTSVPGLPAKPVIDVDLVSPTRPTRRRTSPPWWTQASSTAIREPWWHEHRLLKHDDPSTHLHVFGPDCPEVVRHLMFHDWLVEHAEDRETYADAKQAAAAEMNARPGGGTGMDYNRHKEPVVRDLYDRMFRAHGLLP